MPPWLPHPPNCVLCETLRALTHAGGGEVGGDRWQGCEQGARRALDQERGLICFFSASGSARTQRFARTAWAHCRAGGYQPGHTGHRPSRPSQG